MLRRQTQRPFHEIILKNDEMKNTKIVIFQDYDSGIIVNDVSLIKVDAPFEFNDNVKAIALPEQGYDPESKRQVFFARFGCTNFFFVRGSLLNDVTDVRFLL